jgi:hypothetical protein
MLPLVLLVALGAGSNVSIQVEVLGASDQAAPPKSAAGASQAAPHLERDLRTTLKFKHYRQLAKQSLSVTVAETAEMALPNGAKLRLTPLSLDPAKGMIKLRVQNVKEHYDLDTEYSIKDGGTLFVTAGPYEQEVLVLAITPKVE